MSITSYDLVVVGGGPAGFFAAIACAERVQEANPAQPAHICILEKAIRPLGKVLVSGGGRCNLTHACYEPARLVQFYPRGSAALRGAFTRFQPADTMAWFEKCGVTLKTETDGRVFPASDSSQTIVNCLLQAAQQAGVEWKTGVGVCTTEHLVMDGEQAVAVQASDRFRVETDGGETVFLTRSLLLATGGDPAGMRLAESLGHTIESPVPSLFTFQITDPRLEGLAGVSAAEVSLSLADQHGAALRLPGGKIGGALLVTHWGLSGPAVLRTSAWAARWLSERNYQAVLHVHWLPPLERREVVARLRSWRDDSRHTRQKAALQDMPFERLPQRLWQRLAQAAGVNENQHWSELSNAILDRWAGELVDGQFNIQGKGAFKDEFVACGGVRLDEVDFRTLQSKRFPGLFFAGEILDIDGLTGGFNFQSAWTTGWLAGQALAQEILNRRSGGDC